MLKLTANLEVPVLLPCTHSICKGHVEKSQADTIWCFKCDQEHQIPINVGFTRIEALQNIISTQIGQNSLVDEFKEVWSNCHKLNDFKTDMENLIQEPSNLVHDELEKNKNMDLLYT